MSDEAKTSPGPWRWESSDDYECLIDAEGREILRCDYFPRDDFGRDDLLIASAPTLAARLERAVGLLRDPKRGDYAWELIVDAFLAEVDKP